MPQVTLICGKICSGKSWYARELQRRQGGVILSTDEATYALIENQQGDFYPIFVVRVNRYLRLKAAEIVQAGADVILDWGFWSEKDRQEISAFFAERGVPFVWHYVDVPDALWEKNIRERNARIDAGQGGSDFYVDDGLLKKLRSLFEVPERETIDIWFVPENRE